MYSRFRSKEVFYYFIFKIQLDTNSNFTSSFSTLKETKFEQDLRKKTLLLSERQERILSDLQILRILLHKVCFYFNFYKNEVLG